MDYFANYKPSRRDVSGERPFSCKGCVHYEKKCPPYTWASFTERFCGNFCSASAGEGVI